MRLTGIESDRESAAAAEKPAGKTAEKVVLPGGYPRLGQARELPGNETGVLASDSTAISHAASFVSKTMALPEVDSGKVSGLRVALASGQLGMDPGRLASALMRTMLEGVWS